MRKDLRKTIAENLIISESDEVSFPNLISVSGSICLNKNAKAKKKLSIKKMSVGCYHITFKSEPATYLITDNKKSVRIEKL